MQVEEEEEAPFRISHNNVTAPREMTSPSSSHLPPPVAMGTPHHPDLHPHPPTSFSADGKVNTSSKRQQSSLQHDPNSSQIKIKSAAMAEYFRIHNPPVRLKNHPYKHQNLPDTKKKQKVLQTANSR
ncbi:hypothetical protein JTE90_016698 [Oedothorax gibbosus]|uniref:Uncharacterized protein n=1 Tax=Oedothorax gibbosus TaxID=931172 RepID=A0AAV6V3P9_9ARAC|nr:hypothetical protein JTE90_016698 [Oedothorax gibbosus]